MTFEDLLRKHGMAERSIIILRSHGIVDTKVLLALDKDDLKELDLNLGQRVLLWKLVEKVKASEEEERTSQGGSQGKKNPDRPRGKSSGNDRTKQEEMETNRIPDNTVMTVDEKLDSMTEDHFWCLFWCLGGFAAVGIGGILALIALVKFAPVVAVGAAGIAATTLIAGVVAKLMTLYSGHDATTGVVEGALRSVAELGIHWKMILTTLFNEDVVSKAVEGACAHCFDS